MADLPFREVVGCLMYAAFIVRCDIAFIAGQLAQHCVSVKLYLSLYDAEKEAIYSFSFYPSPTNKSIPLCVRFFFNKKFILVYIWFLSY